jgi:hypothetical protein
VVDVVVAGVAVAVDRAPVVVAEHRAVRAAADREARAKAASAAAGAERARVVIVKAGVAMVAASSSRT